MSDEKLNLACHFLATRVEEMEAALRESVKHWRELRSVDMTPNAGMPYRILRGYLDYAVWTDNTAGMEPTNPIIAQMNKDRIERNAIIERALAALAQSPSPEATMSDLTEVELEAMEKRCEKELEGPWPHVIYPAHARSDVPALIAALREARAERDGFKAENRLLREWLNKATTKLCRLNIAWTWPSPDIARLTAAEAARVQRLEKVAEAAKALRSEHRADFMDDGARQDRLYELFQLLDKHDEAAALAEIDAGEGDDE